MPRRSTEIVIHPVRLSIAIEAFFQALEAEDLSDTTIRSKERTLKELRKVAGGGHVMTRDLTREHFQKALDSLGRGLSEEENEARRLKRMAPVTGRKGGSLGLDRTCLKQFAKFCHGLFWLSTAIQVPERVTHSTKPTGQALRNKVIIPHEDFNEILEIAERIHPRVRIAAAIGMLWCRRISEVVDAQYKDVTADMAVLRNIKRGERAINIPMDWGMEAELDRWKNWLAKEHGEPQGNWYLVPSRLHASEFMPNNRDLKLTVQADPRRWPVDPTRQTRPGSLREDIHKVLRIYGKDQKWEGGHTLRRSGARAFQERYGVEVAQALLDHEDQATTFKYTQNVNGLAKLKDIMQGKDPLEIVGGKLVVTQTSEEPTSNVINMFSRRRAG